jgi:hypothetical protein
MVTPTPPTPPTAPRKPRGGAAKPIRTGKFIREWLLKYGEGAINEIHSELKSAIGKENLRRPRAKWLRAPTYESFVKYFGHLRRIGLVEFVRDEPLVYGHPRMVSIRPPDQVVTSTRRIYRLSAFGADPASDILWEDPLLRGIMRQALIAAMSPPPTG